MNGFFTILVTLTLIAGVVSASEGVEARRGEKVVLLDEKSGFNLSRFSRVALYELSTDCKQLGGEICNYCSPKEKESGCAEKSCSTFSFDIREKSVSVTPLNNASDGCYRAKIFANDVVEKTLIIKANGPLLSTPSLESDPPPWEPTESYSTKGRDPPETESHSTKDTDPPETNGMSWGTAVGIAVGIAAVIAVVIILVIAVVIPGVILICRRCKKFIQNKHKQSEAGDDAGDSEENNSHRESTSGAGELARSESLARRMEDGILRSADEGNLNEVLIDDTSMGQESRRPVQHVQYNNYRDYYNKKNNKNDYEDSNDDSNYHSNDDSKNIPNSGDDDDDDDDNSGGGDDDDDDDDDDDNSGGGGGDGGDDDDDDDNSGGGSDDDDDNSGGGGDDDDDNSGGGSDDDDDNSGGSDDDDDCNKPLKW